jgi:hypothetical protein
MKFILHLLIGFTLSSANAAQYIPDASVAVRKLYSDAFDEKAVVNCSLATSVASSALTITLKDAAGSTPSTASPCKVSFRNATLTTGTYSAVAATAATTLVVSNGSALGCTATAACTLYVYAINNAGTIVLGVIGKNTLDEGTVQTSTAEGGAGAADTGGVLYSTAAQTSKAIRLIGRITITPAASFAWTANSTEISNLPATSGQLQSNKSAGERVERATIAITGTSACSITNQSGTWVTSVSATSFNCALTIETGIFSGTPVCVATLDASNPSNGITTRILSSPAIGSTNVSVQCLSSAAAAVTCNFFIICMGPK